MHGNGAAAIRPAVGRITGRSVTELRFRTGPDEAIHLGELLVVGSPPDPSQMTQMAQMPNGRSSGPSEASETSRAETRRASPPFYLRVVDLEYGAEARDGAWEDRTAGALLAARDADDVVLFDREERLFKSVAAAPLGYLQSDGRFRKPKTLPPLFAEVRRPVAGDFRFLAPRPGDLELGFLRSGDEPLPDRLGLDPKALAQHVGVFATTGMGKSNLLKVVAGAALESGHVGLLVLDPHGEYADGGAAT